MDLATWTARTCVTHLPEVVLEISVEDSLGREVLLPNGCSLVVALKTLACSSLEYCRIKAVRVKLHNLGKVLPRPVDGLLLEVVAERPVSEHLEHCVVVGVVSYLLKVVVLTAYAQTLL